MEVDQSGAYLFGTHRDTEYTDTTCVETRCHVLIFPYKINKPAELSAVGRCGLIFPTFIVAVRAAVVSWRTCDVSLSVPAWAWDGTSPLPIH